MLKKYFSILIALLLAAEPLAAGLRISFSSGHKNRNHHQVGFHQKNNAIRINFNHKVRNKHFSQKGRYNHKKHFVIRFNNRNHHNQRFFRYHNKPAFQYQRFGVSRVVDTGIRRHERILTLRNGMRFKIKHRFQDHRSDSSWIGSKVKVYRRVLNTPKTHSRSISDGYRLVIDGREYWARRFR